MMRKVIFNITFKNFRYLDVYKKYSNLLDNSDTQDVSTFLKEQHSLEGSAKVIQCFYL